MLNKEERQQALKARKDLYYSLGYDLMNIKEKLANLKKNRGQSPAFKMLMLAIDMMDSQIRDDFARYGRRIRFNDNSDNCLLLQKSLNREKKKNADLEKTIEKAKTSSGLFIDFVRSKLCMK